MKSDLQLPQADDSDTPFMRRALELALRASGDTTPNPIVGCVITKENIIIGEGWHQKAGQAHAEIEALQSIDNNRLQNNELLNATLHVTLEPCSHFGRTPPCVAAILKTPIEKIVIGSLDPNPLVAGKGVEALQAAGKKVVISKLESACLFANRRFITFHTKRRPFIILKWAETSDNFIAPSSLEPKAISGEWSRKHLHTWRCREDALLVGTTTAINDNPFLTVRYDLPADRTPLRCIIDRHCKVPLSHHVFDNSTPSFVFTQLPKNTNSHPAYITIPFEESIQEINTVLFENGIQSIIVEGGTSTLQKYLDSNNWDEIRTFTAPLKFTTGLRAPDVPQSGTTLIYKQEIPRTGKATDLLLIYSSNEWTCPTGYSIAKDGDLLGLCPAVFSKFFNWNQ
jgi:diaminohydroxyphosphoribosylaminopyrimidine deaminase / 5-amino-6-(5-phosphoribosylamino)uracil reductase